jgi:3-dehydroquinate synthase
LRRLGFRLYDPALDDANSLLRGLEEFRQHLGGRLTLTMLAGIGGPIDVHEVDTAHMCAAIGAVAAFAQGTDQDLWA